MKDAQDEANRIVNEVITTLKEIGVADKQIATSGYSISQSYDYSKQPSVLVGYTAGNTLRMMINDFDQINGILDVAVEKGTNDVGNIQFSYSDEGIVYKQVLQDAILAAKCRYEEAAWKWSRPDGYGWVYYLTESGLAIVESMYERHMLLSSCLIALGVEEETARGNACRIEHVISQQAFEKIRDHVKCHKVEE